jgi:hypothetical protein
MENIKNIQNCIVNHISIKALISRRVISTETNSLPEETMVKLSGTILQKIW